MNKEVSLLTCFSSYVRYYALEHTTSLSGSLNTKFLKDETENWKVSCIHCTIGKYQGFSFMFSLYCYSWHHSGISLGKGCECITWLKCNLATFLPNRLQHECVYILNVSNTHLMLQTNTSDLIPSKGEIWGTYLSFEPIQTFPCLCNSFGRYG